MGLTMAKLCATRRSTRPELDRTLAGSLGRKTCGPSLAKESASCWLAAYTRARHESAVAEQFRQKGLEAFFLTYTRYNHWSDRVKRVDSPLFPGYVFVRVKDEERVRVIQTVGVVSIVSSAGRPVPLQDTEVEKLRFCTAHTQDIEPHVYLKLGQQVRVKHGPFAGWEGVLIQKKNSTRLVIAIEQINKAVAIDLRGADVEAIW